MKSTSPQLTLALFFLVFLLIFNGCKKADLGRSDLTENYKSILLAQGFDTTGIIEQGEYLIAEGDIAILKSSLRTSERQAAVSSTAPISGFNQTDITILVNNTIPSTGVDNWRDELAQAVNAYNGLGNTNIRLRIITTGQADIVVQSDNGALGDSVIAVGALPSSNKAGATIKLNLDFLNNMTVASGQKIYNLIHEIGHNLGFRHTNWAKRNEPIAVGIGNSPNGTADPDPGSVMNGGTALNNWAGFSDWDVYAVQTLYPRLPFTTTIYGDVPSSSSLYSGQYITVSATTSAKGSTYSWSVSGGSAYSSTTGSSFTAIVGNPETFSVGVLGTSPFGNTAYDYEAAWD